MNTAVVETSQSISAEQKQAALEAVLHSHTFARADQLKCFLKFVCEMELAGRGSELSEYMIGVEALGRSPKYSPGDDSAVRNRAFALRKKLQEYYEHEETAAPVRIELTKGSYCPHFVEYHPAETQKANGVAMSNGSVASSLVSLPPVATELVPGAPIGALQKKQLFGAFLVGVLITALCAGVIYYLSRTKQPAVHANAALAPILAEAWGPLLVPNADVLMCVANPPSLAIHPQRESFTNNATAYLASKDLANWIKQKFPLATEQDLFLTTTTNSTYWGDSLGAIATLKTLNNAGASSHIFPEKVTTIPTLRRRNVILFGAPAYSPAIAHFLEKCPLTVNYLSGVVSRETSDAPRYSLKRNQQLRAIEVYGLITVLPSESSTENQHRTVIFSGVNSAGAQAAAEFFSSPEHLRELQKQLQKEGHDRFPPAYQVVVKAEPDDNILLSFKYETHRVIPTPSRH